MIKTVQATLAAERDRLAVRNAGLEKEKLELEIRRLSHVDLERQKLELEVARLRNSPEVVADRRAIYDRLRATLQAITREAAVQVPQLNEVHQIRHDSEFRFPTEIVDALGELTNDCVTLYVTNKGLARGPSRQPTAVWDSLAEDNAAAL